MNIPDTVGYTMPDEFRSLIEHLRRTVPNLGKAVISVHCHNDLGMAVANSLAAVLAGARQVECTVNGIGERAGNASLEEVVMALRTRRDLYPVRTGVETRELCAASRLLTEITGMVVQRNKAIVGQKRLRPRGRESTSTACSATAPPTRSCSRRMWGGRGMCWCSASTAAATRSGRGSANWASRPAAGEMDAIFRDFKRLADRRKEIHDDDLTALMGQRRAGRTAPPAQAAAAPLVG